VGRESTLTETPNPSDQLCTCTANQEKTAFFQSAGVPLGIARRLELLAEPFSGSSRKRKGEFDGGEPDAKKLFEDESRKWAGMG
jgi:hypothetical protein